MLLACSVCFYFFEPTILSVEINCCLLFIIMAVGKCMSGKKEAEKEDL
jgi:hypothetical protein